MKWPAARVRSTKAWIDMLRSDGWMDGEKVRIQDPCIRFFRSSILNYFFVLFPDRYPVASGSSRSISYSWQQRTWTKRDLSAGLFSFLGSDRSLQRRGRTSSH
jgi:hypothetical protein